MDAVALALRAERPAGARLLSTIGKAAVRAGCQQSVDRAS
jgi:hypothetical protein